MLALDLRKHIHLFYLHASVDKPNALLQLEQLFIGHDVCVDIFTKQMNAFLCNLKLVNRIIEVLRLQSQELQVVLVLLNLLLRRHSRWHNWRAVVLGLSDDRL